MKYTFLIGLFVVNLLWIPATSYATPSEVYIIRHADKLTNNPGPALSAKGEVRAIAFAIQFARHFPKPDYIFATDPVSDKIQGLYRKGLSIRELQTVGPYANLLAANTHQPIVILHPYRNKDYSLLARDLLTKKEFDNKRILICWDHTLIRQLAIALGAPKATLYQHWQKTNFDSILYIKFEDKRITSTLLMNQYPLKKADHITWDTLYDQLNASIAI